MKTKMKIKELFAPCKLFVHIDTTNPPWKGKIAPEMLDLLWLARSGGKRPSALVEGYAQKGEPLSDDTQHTLATLTALYCRENWDMVYKALTKEYEPLDNYNMIEKGTDTDNTTVTDKGGHTKTTDTNNTYTTDRTETGENSSTSVKTGNVTNKSDLNNTDTTTTSHDKDVETRKYGAKGDTGDVTEEVVHTSAYNDEDTYPIKEKTITTSTPGHTETIEKEGEVKEVAKHTGDITDTTKYNDVKDESNGNHLVGTKGTDTNSGHDTETLSNNNTNTTDGTKKHDLTRSGNIGVTTSQQMLESEILLRRNNYLLDIIFESVDRVLALRIY